MANVATDHQGIGSSPTKPNNWDICSDTLCTRTEETTFQSHVAWFPPPLGGPVATFASMSTCRLKHEIQKKRCVFVFGTVWGSYMFHEDVRSQRKYPLHVTLSDWLTYLTKESRIAVQSQPIRLVREPHAQTGQECGGSVRVAEQPEQRGATLPRKPMDTCGQDVRPSADGQKPTGELLALTPLLHGTQTFLC